jgi:filamentous hemagglutinin
MLSGAGAVRTAVAQAGKTAVKAADDVAGAAVKAENQTGTNVNAQAALNAKLSGLEKAQKAAAITKTLPDGRIRYYTEEIPARTEGSTRGASFVTEFDPKTGNTRQWMESYDHSGTVIRVHPKSINGQPVNAQHYPPTGAELRSWD